MVRRQPVVADTVLYLDSREGQRFAAIITDPDYPVNVVHHDRGRWVSHYQALTVFPPMRQSFFTAAPYDPGDVPGTWKFKEDTNG